MAETRRRREDDTVPRTAAVSAVRPWDLSQPPRIPVARPKLAALEAALPYLREIDDGRTYSNYGPLNARFEARLAERLGLPAGCVVTCNNATTGLTLALQAAAARGGRYCLMPAWTFAATAHAAIAAGLTPFLADVDPLTGALTPQIAKAALREAPGAVAAVLPVAPFGRPLDPEAWDLFEEISGVPVVIDAAAGFDAAKPGFAASVVSLHATKALGIGEGGFIASCDLEFIADMRRRSNFGFNGSRDAELSGCNGKLSEYGAAFGHAALDTWTVQRLQLQAVLAYYRAALAGLPVRIAGGLGETWVCSTFNIEAPEPAILAIEQALAEVGVATRRWWGRGLHGHQAFADLPRTALPMTERLAAETLGLPCWPGLETAAIDEIAAIVRDALSRP
jgi:dTDP-4-amino-4,6-dideoxygalactose transaminase